ncbi:MAG: CopD family protein [Actinomycetota bacterium]
MAGLASRAARAVLGALTPYAVAAAAVLAATGTLNAALEVEHPRQLASTGYGRAIVVKIGVLVVMGVLGAIHFWLRRRAAADRLLRRPLRLEAAAAVLGLAAAAVLVATPNPPREAEATTDAAGPDPVLAHLGDYDAVSLADATGEHVIGVTVIPPRPGPVEIRVSVVGAAGDDEIDGAGLVVTSPDGARLAVPVEGCGRGCFTGRARLGAAGSWTVRFTGRSSSSTLDARWPRRCQRPRPTTRCAAPSGPWSSFGRR